MTERFADPEERARQSAAIKAQFKNPERRAKRSATSKAMWSDPERRARMSASAQAMWSDPEHREKLRAIHQDPQYRVQQSEAIRVKWENPDYRLKQIAAATGRKYTPEARAKMSANAANRKPTWNPAIERIVEDDFIRYGLRKGVDFIPQAYLHSPADYPEEFSCRSDFLIIKLRKRIECNGKFHHADSRYYPDPEKWTAIQRHTVKCYTRKVRLYEHLGEQLIELWSPEDDRREELLIWPLVAELACLDFDFDALEADLVGDAR